MSNEAEREAFEAWQRKDGWKRPDDAGEREAFQAGAAYQRTQAQPADALVEALRLAANRLDRLTHEVSGGYWRSSAAEWAGEARAALARRS